MKGFGLAAVLLFFVLSGCQSSRKSNGPKATKTVAQNSAADVEVNILPYHLNDSVTRIYLKIDNENLLYKRPDTSKAFYTELRFFYRLLADRSSQVFSDSGSFTFIDRSESEIIRQKNLFVNFDVRARRGNDYLLELDLTDVSRRTRYIKESELYKESNFSAQNFLVKLRDSVMFSKNFIRGEVIDVYVSDDAVKQVTVDCFFKDFGPALPPFSTKPPDEFKYRPDSSFVIPYITKKFSLTVPDRGFYHIKANELRQEGLSLYTFDETFPGVSSSAEMIESTRYIMFREEFEKCRDAADKKAAIDQFWLNLGGSMERARELLRRYYTRVLEANKMYSSYTQGWKSDRGMIYIVLGPPANTFRSKKEEVWLYGSESNPNALRFVFRKTKNPFSENDFILERSPLYKEPYHTAVEYWRQGLIYSDSRK